MKKTLFSIFIALIGFKAISQVILPKKVDKISPVIVSPDIKKVLATGSVAVSSAMVAGKYFLKTALVDRYLDIKDGNFNPGSSLQIWDLHGGWGQVWEAIPSGDADYFYLKSETARYLDVQNANPAKEAAVQMWSFNGSNAQKWKFIPQAGGYSIQSKLGTYLDVNAAGTANGNVVWMWEKQTNAGLANAQKWLCLPAGKGNELNGFVDMHTHPMSYLGFGKKLMHGAPDIGSIIPAGTRNCNPTDFRARTMEEALGNCNSTHGGWGIDNTCGDYIRAIAISKAADDEYVFNVDHNPFTGGNLHGDHQHAFVETSPNFQYLPHQSSKVHQQMWWEWIKRAYDQGGLRVMVALTVNNELLADVLNGDAPKDDKGTSDLQIDEIKAFVGRHDDFMQVAYSATDVKNIIYNNKLAVIIGMEVDDIGNFNKTTINETTVRNEIQRIYNKGVRYIFPIHLTDNKLGGTAVYEDMFNYATKFTTGKLIEVESAASLDASITKRMGNGLDDHGNLAIGAVLAAASGIPFPPALHIINCPIPTLGCWDKFQKTGALLAPNPQYASYSAISGGHINKLGLTPIGIFAVKEMMKLGMIIDIDHMSQKSINATLEIAESFRYPINIGHNGLRGTEASERNASRATTTRVSALGGMFGVGTSDSDDGHADAVSYITNFQQVWTVMGNRAVAMGTDVNGMERLPRASPGLSTDRFYSGGFTKCRTGSREWDYTTEGVTHYGLMADFMQDIKTRNSTVYNNLMKSSDYFAQMWEKCERSAINVR
jgi:microsomal dipeptidase-like Zn-dependent dipeptidase